MERRWWWAPRMTSSRRWGKREETTRKSNRGTRGASNTTRWGSGWRIKMRREDNAGRTLGATRWGRVYRGRGWRKNRSIKTRTPNTSLVCIFFQGGWLFHIRLLLKWRKLQLQYSCNFLLMNSSILHTVETLLCTLCFHNIKHILLQYIISEICEILYNVM